MTARPAVVGALRALQPAVTPYPLGASSAEAVVVQAEAAVHLLERFAAELGDAAAAADDGDVEALGLALAERERLLARLGPLLAPLAAARREVASEATRGHEGEQWPDGWDAGWADTACAVALARVDAALATAQRLHAELHARVAALRALPEAPAAGSLRVVGR